MYVCLSVWNIVTFAGLILTKIFRHILTFNTKAYVHLHLAMTGIYN